MSPTYHCDLNRTDSELNEGESEWHSYQPYLLPLSSHMKLTASKRVSPILAPPETSRMSLSPGQPDCEQRL